MEQREYEFKYEFELFYLCAINLCLVNPSTIKFTNEMGIAAIFLNEIANMTKKQCSSLT